MNSEVVGRMIFANVLEMSINKYLNYVDEFFTITSPAPFYIVHHIDERILTRIPKGVTGAVVEEEDRFRFYSPEYVKLDFELLGEPNDIKWKYHMNWIRTKNLFLHHVMTNVLALQRNFWETRDHKTIVPISLKEFWEGYPFPYLDVSRLSRLLNNTCISFNGAEYLLRDLFCSRRKVYVSILEHVIYQQAHRMKDREIQALLKRDYGIDLSVRTICNYRNSVQIPAYNKYHLGNPYTTCFSRALILHKKSLPQIPETAGVYEISIDRDIKYPKFASRMIYFGRSRNLRRRIQNYLHANIKNPVIKSFQECQKLFIRYFATSKYAQVEEELLRQFLDKFGSLPVANKLLNKEVVSRKKEEAII